MAEIVKANIANALNSLSGVLGTADQIKMNNDTTAADVATALGYKQDSFNVDASLELQNNVLKVAQGGIDTYRLATASVTADKIADNAVTTAKLASQAVDDTKIADGAIHHTHIAAGEIEHNHIAAGAITESNLNSWVVDKVYGLNVGQIVTTSGNSVTFGSQFNRIEDLLEYDYYAKDSYGYWKLIPHLDTTIAYSNIVSGQTVYRCMFEYKDDYLDWGADSSGSSKYATTHGCMIPTWCYYDEYHIIFIFAGSESDRGDCAGVLDNTVNHIEGFSQFYPSGTSASEGGAGD